MSPGRKLRWPYVYLLVLSGYATGVTQQPEISTDDMNRAILLRWEAIEAAVEGQIRESHRLISAARNMDPCRLDHLLVSGLFDELENGSIDPKVADLMFSAIGMLDNGNNETALKVLQKLPLPESLHPVAGLLLGRIYAGMDSAEMALQYYNRADRIPLGLLWRAELLIKMEDKEQASSDLMECLQRVPCSYQAAFALGSIRLSERDYAGAIHYFEQVLAVYPGYVHLLQPNLEICAAYNGRGREFLETGELDLALADFDRAVAINPRFGEFYLNRGITYRAMGNANAALKDFDRALLLDGKYIEVYYNRGLIFYGMQNWPQALNDFKRVLGFKRDHAGALYHTGSIYMQREMYEQAVDIFDSLLAYQPEHYRAIYLKALALDELKHYRSAAEAYETFFTLAPDSLYEHKISAWERARLIRKVLKEKYGE